MRDHVYLRHLSTEYRSILSADMPTDSRPICRPSIGRYVGRHVGRVSVDMLVELIDRRSTLSVGMSVDTRPTSRLVCRWCIGRLSVVYRSTVGGVSVDCRWYRSIVNRCFVEIAAVSLPTGDAKEDSIPYARVLIERRCSSNATISNTYLMQLEVSTSTEWEKRDSHEHIPGCSIDGKKKTVDRSISKRTTATESPSQRARKYYLTVEWGR